MGLKVGESVAEILLLGQIIRNHMRDNNVSLEAMTEEDDFKIQKEYDECMASFLKAIEKSKNDPSA